MTGKRHQDEEKGRVRRISSGGELRRIGDQEGGKQRNLSLKKANARKRPSLGTPSFAAKENFAREGKGRKEKPFRQQGCVKLLTKISTMVGR